MGRGGRASSKLHSDYFNLRREDEQQSGVHLDKTEWRFDNAAKNQLGGVQEEEEEVEEANIALIPAKDHSRQECVEAKQKDLKAFEDFEVYTEVEDKGQERLSSRWILTDKSTPQEVKVKARLVCRGFEETVEVQADSPTGSKETLHMLLCIAATKGWKIKSGDVKKFTTMKLIAFHTQSLLQLKLVSVLLVLLYTALVIPSHRLCSKHT